MAREDRPARGLSAGAASAEERVRQALRTVYDPEVGESVVDLGLVYRIACEPAAIREACSEVPEVRVAVVFDPPWTPGRMSAEAKRRFGR